MHRLYIVPYLGSRVNPIDRGRYGRSVGSDPSADDRLGVSESRRAEGPDRGRMSQAAALGRSRRLELHSL